MRNQRKRFEEFFLSSRCVRTPEDEVAVLEFADAYDAAVESGELSPERLMTIVNAASSPRAILWMNAIDLLGALALRWDAATQAIAEMFASRQSQVRFAALCCLWPETSLEVADRLLRSGLADKSSRVRRKAAQTIGQFERKRFLPELEVALSREKNAKARDSIEFELRLLRDGHIVEQSTPSSLIVTVRPKRGGIASRFVSATEFLEQGVEAIVADLRNR